MGALLLINASATTLTDISDAIMARTDVVRVEILKAFSALDTLAEEPCSKSHREALRRIVFLSEHIKDIGYHRDGYLLCTFGLGTLPHPMPIPPATVVSDGGVEVIADIEVNWAPQLKLTVARKGNYGLSLRKGSVADAILPAGVMISWMTLDRSTGQVTVREGERLNVKATDLQHGTSRWRDGRVIVADCTKNHAVCYALSLSWTQVIANYRPLLLAFAAGGGLLGAMTGSGVLLFGQRRRSIEYLLRRAIKSGELSMVYQPIVDAHSKTIVAAEALMRWSLPDGQCVAPDVFLPVAQAGGFSNEITQLAIEKVSMNLGDMLRARPSLWVSINIEADDLKKGELLHLLETCFVRRGIAASQVALELTERAALDTTAARKAVQGLRERGYRIFIDDFGTGYSSLSYLKDVVVDAIKIDKSFTALVSTSSRHTGLVSAMLDMAKSLSIAVIAEGVETQAQVDYFIKHDVEMLQGWLLGGPSSAIEMNARLSDQPRSPATGKSGGKLDA
jgi:sensor c-di-GMP phosphodiesterase-like protein